MKALIVMGTLCVCLLGAMTVPRAAEAAGPQCLRIVEFGEVAQFFTLPAGGGQFILTGQSLTFGDAYTGSGYLTPGDFVFTLASGLLPGVLEGILTLGTGKGTGSVTFADTGEIRALNYVLFAPPCVRP